VRQVEHEPVGWVVLIDRICGIMSGKRHFPGGIGTVMVSHNVSRGTL